MPAALLAALAGGPTLAAADTRAAFDAAVAANDCSTALPLARKLANDRGEARPVREHAFTVDSFCTFQLGRLAEAGAVMARAMAAFPDWVAFPIATFVLAVENGATDAALEAMERGLALAPDLMRQLDPDLVDRLSRSLRESGRAAERARMAGQLADIGFGGDDLEVRDRWLVEAIRFRLDAGDMAGAEALAARAAHPEKLRELLTERRYAPLWPALEARLSDGLATEAAVALALARSHADATGPAEASARAARAHRGLMLRLAEAERRGLEPAGGALALGEGLFTDAEAVRRAGSPAGWFIDAHAELLAEAGDAAASDRRSRALAAMDLGSSGDRWRVSMRINHMLRLRRIGATGLAEAALPGAADSAERFGTPYARQLVAWARICLAVARGARDEAEGLRATLLRLEAVGGSPNTSALALDCLGDSAAAAERLVAGLASADWRDGAVELLRLPFAHEVQPVVTLRPLLDRPEVAAAFAAVARDLPQRLR